MRRLLFTLVALALMLAALPRASHASGLPSLPDEALLTDPIWARNGFANLAYAFTNRTRYLIALNVDHRRGILSGKARVLYVNNDGVPHNEVIFRLYPNHPVHQSRRMQITALSVNGVPSAGQLRDATTRSACQQAATSFTSASRCRWSPFTIRQAGGKRWRPKVWITLILRRRSTLCACARQATTAHGSSARSKALRTTAMARQLTQL